MKRNNKKRWKNSNMKQEEWTKQKKMYSNNRLYRLWFIIVRIIMIIIIIRIECSWILFCSLMEFCFFHLYIDWKKITNFKLETFVSDSWFIIVLICITLFLNSFQVLYTKRYYHEILSFSKSIYLIEYCNSFILFFSFTLFHRRLFY